MTPLMMRRATPQGQLGPGIDDAIACTPAAARRPT